MGKGEKRVNWDIIRAEYIAGGISQKKLAEKYGLKYSALRFQADSGGWVQAREKARQKAINLTAQKTAEAAANNAAIAQRIRGKLLIRLEREIDDMPDERVGSLSYVQTEGKGLDKHGKPVKKRSGIEYKLREFAAALKDLTADMQQESGGSNELLQSLLELERGAGNGD